MYYQDFIIKFLEKNYKVSTNHETFILIDKVNKSIYINHDTSRFLITVLIPILTSDNSETSSIVAKTFEKWWEDEKNKITNRLNLIFDSFLPSISSRTVLYKILKKYDLDIDVDFITKMFNKYFIDKWLNRYIDNYLSHVDVTIGSLKIIGNFNIQYPDQTPFIDKYIYKTINEWYSDNVLINIIDDFVVNTTATLTKTDWVVTWGKHGVIDKKFLTNYFPLETSYQLDILEKVYDDIIIDKSVIHMKNW